MYLSAKFQLNPVTFTDFRVGGGWLASIKKPVPNRVKCYLHMCMVLFQTFNDRVKHQPSEHKEVCFYMIFLVNG